MKFANPFKGDKTKKPQGKQPRVVNKRSHTAQPDTYAEDEYLEDQEMEHTTQAIRRAQSGQVQSQVIANPGGNGDNPQQGGTVVIRRAPAAIQGDAAVTLADYIVRPPEDKECELTRLTDRDIMLLPLAEVEEMALDPKREPGSLLRILRYSIYRHKKGYKAWHAIHIVNLAQGQAQDEQFQHDVFR
jgi:hypothetical protein